MFSLERVQSLKGNCANCDLDAPESASVSLVSQPCLRIRSLQRN
jgi:hypothetical protein